MLVYALWEFSKFERRDAREEIIYHFRICAPNLRVHPESLRLADMASPAFFAEISKFLQRNFFAGEAANLTKDDAMCYDFGMWIAERIAQDNQGWLASTATRQSLNDNFALTPARSGVNTVKSMISVGTRKLQRVTSRSRSSGIARGPENLFKGPTKGNKTHYGVFVGSSAEDSSGGRNIQRMDSHREKGRWNSLRVGQNLETMEMIHLLGWTWSPVILAKVYQLDPEVSGALPGILARLTLAEIVALFVAVGPEEFGSGSHKNL